MIRLERPPNYDKIVAAFPRAADHGVLFAWAGDIFNPSRVRLTNWLEAHEHRHGARQFTFLGGPEKWWDQYIVDPVFRYAEELVAHGTEYFVQLQAVRGRNERARTLWRTANRLRMPLYEYGEHRPSVKQAMADIEALV